MKKNPKSLTATYEAWRAGVTEIETIHGTSDVEPHWHQSVEILVALNDEVYALVNGEERVLHPGEICIADCFDIHSFNSYGKDVFVTILPYEVLTDYLKLKGKRRLAASFLTDPTQCRELFAALIKLDEAQNSPLLLQGYANVVMGLAVNAVGLKTTADADVGLMQKILNYLEEHYHAEVTLGTLAAKFGYSKYYFSRMFNRFFKFSLNEYMARLRIRRFIAAMQENKQADMIGTALDCGFGSFQTFYRCFKQYYGTSPKKYLSPDSIT